MFPILAQPAQPLSPKEFEDFKRNFPKDVQAKLEKRQAELLKEQEIREKQNEIKLSKVLDSETLMRFAYVPFVIANLAWDYADTIVDLARMMKLKETKPLCRAIIELKKEYDRIRAPYNSDSPSYESNMYVFEEGVADIFNLYLANVGIDLKCEYPDLQEDYIIFLKAVYQCHIVLQSIYEYVRKQKIKIEGIVKHTIGDVLPSQLRRLDILVMAFVGDKPISQKFQEQQKVYANNLSIKIALIELTDKDDE